MIQQSAFNDSQDENNKINIVDQIINRSLQIQPYMVGDFNNECKKYIKFIENAWQSYYQRVLQSLKFNACRLANRQCSDPKIKIDGQLIFEYQNINSNRIKKDYTTHQCFKNNSFILSVEGQPNYSLIITKNGKNPLLADHKDRIVSRKSYQEKIQSPCIISVVAIFQQYRLPSRILTVEVKKNTGSEQKNEINRQSGMVRPDAEMDLQASRSNYSNVFWL